MRFVQDAGRVPNRCAFYPQIGPSHPEGFVESDMLVDDHFSTYVSVTALREIALTIPQVGLCPRSELVEAQARLEAIKAENEALKEDLKQADQVINAIDVLEGAEFRARKKPGRKPAAKAA